MSFKYAVLTVREIEIAGYLKGKYSLKEMEEITGLSKKILKAHLSNMMKKLKANNPDDLIRILDLMDH